MPGRRLTRADRRQIAAGLEQGLDYAAIARRLGRPTSTVSREVARNGGPGRYRADLAHLATTHRARRTLRPPQATGHTAPDAPAAYTAATATAGATGTSSTRTQVSAPQ